MKYALCYSHATGFFYGIKNLVKKILMEVDVRLAKHFAVVKKEIVILESKRF